MTIAFERQQREERLKAFAYATCRVVTDSEPASEREYWPWHVPQDDDVVRYQKREHYYCVAASCLDPFTNRVDVQARPPAAVAIDDHSLFHALRNRWYVERGVTSSTTDLVTCPSYLRIIGMGASALPFILEQLVQEGDDPDHWFAALEAITGANPVGFDDYGDTVAMRRAWFRWALATHAG